MTRAVGFWRSAVWRDRAASCFSGPYGPSWKMKGPAWGYWNWPTAIYGKYKRGNILVTWPFNFLVLEYKRLKKNCNFRYVFSKNAHRKGLVDPTQHWKRLANPKSCKQGTILRFQPFLECFFGGQNNPSKSQKINDSRLWKFQRLYFGWFPGTSGFC